MTNLKKYMIMVGLRFIFLLILMPITVAYLNFTSITWLSIPCIMMSVYGIRGIPGWYKFKLYIIANSASFTRTSNFHKVNVEDITTPVNNIKGLVHSQVPAYSITDFHRTMTSFSNYNSFLSIPFCLVMIVAMLTVEVFTFSWILRSFSGMMGLSIIVSMVVLSILYLYIEKRYAYKASEDFKSFFNEQILPIVENPETISLKETHFPITFRNVV